MAEGCEVTDIDIGQPLSGWCTIVDVGTGGRIQQSKTR
jgi:hypothetical protein